MNITVNGKPRSCSDGCTISRLLAELKVPQVAVAVEVNREIVSRAQHPGRQFKDGDVVEIVTFVGGG